MQALLDAIEPGHSGLDLNQARKALVEQAVEANVRWSIKQLRMMACIAPQPVR